jgi:hypothetical protein
VAAVGETEGPWKEARNAQAHDRGDQHLKRRVAYMPPSQRSTARNCLLMTTETTASQSLFADDDGEAREAIAAIRQFVETQEN